jgi:hypothetical protein
MATAERNTIISQLLDPVTQCLTPEVARRIVALKASPSLQSHVNRLADKANAGSLQDSERSEYEQYIRFSQFITLLQIKARDLLDESLETD